MWKFINQIFFCLVIFILALLFLSCEEKKKEQFSRHFLGYRFHLISFTSDSACYNRGKIARVTAVFKTQSDSVFWDSHNNLNGNLFISIDSTVKNNFFKYQVSKSCVSDSVCLQFKTKDFFSQLFKSDTIPFFSEKDSIVKINFRIKELFDRSDFEKLNIRLHDEELKQIESYFRSPADFELAKDPAGFYWLLKPKTIARPAIENGDQVVITYEARFLNGRFFEKSAGSFEFIYGTPDQLLKGLNYVIGRLKLGQTAKILLPSRLAFGESGSSNNVVPPYTPLIYEVKIIDVKKIK